MAGSALVGANIISPNILELEQITKGKIGTVDEAIEACSYCLETASQLDLCFVKHLSYAGFDQNSFEMLLVQRGGAAWHISTPLLPMAKAPVGVGDLTSAVFLANYLQGKSPVECLEATTAAYFAVMEVTTRNTDGNYPLYMSSNNHVKVHSPNLYVCDGLVTESPTTNAEGDFAGDGAAGSSGA